MKKALAMIALMSAAAHAEAVHAACDSLEDLRWLLGNWIAEGSKSSFHESWREAGPHTFEGAGVEQSKADGAVKGSEDLRLVQTAGEVFYVSKVSHNDLPVAFRLTACSDGRFVFENAAHDFPRRLEYRRDADDRLMVEASNGAGKGFGLDFGRVAADAVPVDPAARVLAAEDARFAAMLSADAAAMRHWFAPDLHYTHSTGQVENRDQFIDSIASGRLRYLSVTTSDRKVSMLGANAALVRGRARMRAARGEATIELQIRYLAVYRWLDGNWVLQAWQSTTLP